MASHLLIGGFVYILSLGPLIFLIVRRVRHWSAFRLLILWQIITIAALQPLMWAAAVSPECWYWFNVLTWETRSITVLTFLIAAYELAGFRALGEFLGSVCALAMALGQGHDWIATLYSSAGFLSAGACGLTLAREFLQGHKNFSGVSKFNRLAAGLLVLTFFPAIAEISGALENGGWSRMVPTLSIWLACVIWLLPTKSPVAFPRKATSLNHGRAFKRPVARGFRGSKEAKRA